MKKQLLILLLPFLIASCSKSSDSTPQNTTPTVTVPQPTKIELSSNWSTVFTTSAVINSDNIEEIILSTKVTDKNGSTLNTDCKMTLNGNSFTSTSFKTLTPGSYIFQASIGDLKSNEYKVTAKDLAQRYASILTSSIYSVNSVGLVTVGIGYKNISTKRLKYINFSVSCYNRVNDIIKEEIKGSVSISCRATGFFEPAQSTASYFEIGYFTGASSIKATLQSVTFEDGTIVTAS